MIHQESNKTLERQDSNHQSEYFSKKSSIKMDNNVLKNEEKLNNHSKGSINQESFEKELEVGNQHL